MLALICSSVSNCRVSSRPDGSPDLGGAAAHQNDGTVAGLLQAAQQHDLYETADVQAVGRRIEADVGGNDAGLRACVEARGIGYLVDETAIG